MSQQYGNAQSITVQMAGPFSRGGGASAKLTEITLPASAWKGALSPYSQVVNVDGVSINSMVDLQPTIDQIEEFRDNNLAFLAENDEGVITVYAIGNKPVNDYTIQATVMEVVV